MKGIVLAGGTGSRLYPITQGISKQLLPIYDKPMVYYPLSVLMLSGIRDILLISNPEFINLYRQLLGDGSNFGVNLAYATQGTPRGLADALLVGEAFIGNDNVCLILGDNVFYGQGFVPMLRAAATLSDGATIFGYYVTNPSDFGVVEFSPDGVVKSLEEKPHQPKSSYAIPGLYFYDNSVIARARQLQPSPRGELEITDLNRTYLLDNKLKVQILGRGFAWLDTGTYEGLSEASEFVRTIQRRTNRYVACLEEIAFANQWIGIEQLFSIGKYYSKTTYGHYILGLANSFMQGEEA